MEYYKNYDLADIVYFCDFDNIWKTEQWKNIVNYEGLYKISDLGRIKSLQRKQWNGFSFFIKEEMILKQSLCNKNYPKIGLWKNNNHKTFRTHQLIIMSFKGHFLNRKTVIDHIDNDKNNNTINNLQVVTNRHNSIKDKNPKSGYSCIYFNSNSWLVRMRVNGIKTTVGTFKDINEAIKQRDLFITQLDNT